MKITLEKTEFSTQLKTKLANTKWALIHMLFGIRYHLSVLLNLPLKKQVEWLPPPIMPPIYWTSIDQVKYQSSLDYPPRGRWCHTDDWDVNMIYELPSIFEKIPKDSKKWDVHQTIRKMFLHKKKYSKTPQYKRMIYKVNQGDPNPPQGCDTHDAVKSYFKELKKAYKSMKKKGYLTQAQQGKPSVEEIRLHVTRNGELCLGTGGNHRIRMAELLGIDNIPFLLRGIHSKWVIKLCERTGLPPHKAIESWINQNFSRLKYIDQPLTTLTK
ncbi:hypothetical protein [Echinicola salinicaeni]|uniref:hypothetical protein n=1 Tax=Echinicola salinicaeni TaxID=2762757 RepID=UPI001644AADC|nr:hypothetical protein [Echinicola salinicaeni]